MCLENGTSGKNWARQFKQQKYITCYKLLDVVLVKNKINSLKSPVRRCIYEPGTIISDREINPDTNSFEKIGKDFSDWPIRKYNWNVKHGIHVYTTRKQALIFKLSDEVILSVRCLAKDLIAYSQKDQEAVFYKILVEQREYDRVLNKGTIC